MQVDSDLNVWWTFLYWYRLKWFKYFGKEREGMSPQKFKISCLESKLKHFLPPALFDEY